MKNISEVLSRLKAIVEENRARDNALGYFPALYYQMTAAVRDGILTGAFEDGHRMERLDVIFAQRYLDAYDAWTAGKPAARSWTAAFEAANDSDLCVLQHLLLGINAHINFDLGIAAAQVSPENEIFSLEKDFNRINEIIADLTETVQDRLADICPPFRLLDAALRTQDEGIADFSIAVARKTAWNSALGLAFLTGEARETFINGIDQGVAAFADRLRAPKGWVLRSALRVIRLSETGDTREKIGRLTM